MRVIQGFVPSKCPFFNPQIALGRFISVSKRVLRAGCKFHPSKMRLKALLYSIKNMVSLLENRTWRTLRLTAHAHGLPFHTRHTRSQVYDRLYRQLVDEGRLKRCFKQLSDEERAVLAALQAGGGSLPLHPFQKSYGEIRAYRPWRGDGTQPWKRPQSSAEKLWHLGFIEIIKGRPDQAVLPEEVAALLPPLPHPRPTLQAPQALRQGEGANPCENLCLDMAMLVGFLLDQAVRPLHGRWMPPSALRAVHQRLHVQENLDGVRSELQTGRLRFLHYLAEAAGLVAVQGCYLQPTAAAWRWLRLPAGERWQSLLDAVKADLARRDRLWERYRLPSTDRQRWGVLMEQLDQLMPGCVYSREAFFQGIRPYLHDDLESSVMALLREPLTWLGIVQMEADAIAIMPRSFREPQNARLMLQKESIDVILPDVPHLHSLVGCCAWAKMEGHKLVIDVDAIAGALEKGSDARQIAALLAELGGAPLPSEIYERIESWARKAQSLTLRQVFLLTARDPAVLTDIRSDWRLRPLLGEPLSPHHMLVLSGHELLPKLERRGCRVTSHLTPSSSPDHSQISPEIVEYLWLAVRVYQKLGAFVPQDIHIPGAAREWLTAQLHNGDADRLEAESSILIDQLAQVIQGKTISPPAIQQENPADIKIAVQSAYEGRGALTIEYFSPARGEKTIRTIEPVMLYERNGAAYVEAWCRLDEDTRTFRLDRILRVIEDGNSAG